MKCENCKYFYIFNYGKYCGLKGDYLEKGEDYSKCEGFKAKEEN